jgi:hypothetical protein
VSLITLQSVDGHKLAPLSKRGDTKCRSHLPSEDGQVSSMEWATINPEASTFRFQPIPLPEANPGRLRPKEGSQHLLTQAARDRETAESLGQKWGVGGASV